MFILLRQRTKSTFFPYTTLFRSWERGLGGEGEQEAAGPPPPVAFDPPVTDHGGGRAFASIEEVRHGWVERHRRSEEHTSELQSRLHLVCRLLLEKKNYLYSKAAS